MRKPYLSISFACISFILAFVPVLNAGSKNAGKFITTSSSFKSSNVNKESSYKAFSALLYDSLNLQQKGLSLKAVEYAYKGYQKLLRKGAIAREGIITICDFSQPSSRKRMYIIDVDNFKMLVNTYVAHGKNSGLQYAKRFSNRPESLQSSLGFFVTKNTYFGKHGLSLRLGGMERGINDKAEQRAVVLHGADYIGAHRLKAPYMGRSFGCPAVPDAVASKVIKLIKDKTCFFIYHPDASYLHGSKILNG